MSKEAIKLALGVLRPPYHDVPLDDVIEALEEELAKQEQGEPVGFYDARGNDICIEIPIGESADWWQPVYTSPQQRAWVGLTSEDYNEIFNKARTVEHAVQLAATKLKEKNT